MESSKTTIHDFFDRYGIDTTTNFQLIHWAKELGIPNFYYKMKDELIDLKHKEKSPLYVISNYHRSDQPGLHHIAIYKDKSKDICYFFNSYGYAPLPEVMDFLDDTKERYYSSFKLQDFNTQYCGQISLFILFKLSRGEDFFDTILTLKDSLKK